MPSRESRITLIRHGPSAHVHREGWIDAAGIQRYRTAYDEAGIAADSVPPQPLIDLASQADLIAASDLPRAVASAERLAPERPIVLSPLLRETVLEAPNWLPMRWPLPAWEALIHAQWAYQILRGTDAPPEELKRAGTAATWLTKHSDESASIVVVTHGVFRRLLAERLARKEWEPDPGRQSYDTWSAWGFRRKLR